MLFKVIYPDGSSGMVKSQMLAGLMKSGGIIAFHCSAGWVEVRRRSEASTYKGIDRRRTKPENFYAKF